MIEQLIYSPFLQKNIPVKAENQAELEKHIELFAQLRNESSEDIWHIWAGWKALGYEVVHGSKSAF